MPEGSREVTAQITGFVWQGGRRLAVRIDMAWGEDDPLFVHVEFKESHNARHIATWDLSREGLALAVTGVAYGFASGDAIMWRASSGVMLRLRSPDGISVIQVPLGAVKGFLERTDLVVAPGSQKEQTLLDHLIEAGVEMILEQEERP